MKRMRRAAYIFGAAMSWALAVPALAAIAGTVDSLSASVMHFPNWRGGAAARRRRPCQPGRPGCHGGGFSGFAQDDARSFAERENPDAYRSRSLFGDRQGRQLKLATVAGRRDAFAQSARSTHRATGSVRRSSRWAYAAPTMRPPITEPGVEPGVYDTGKRERRNPAAAHQGAARRVTPLRKRRAGQKES